MTSPNDNKKLTYRNDLNEKELLITKTNLGLIGKLFGNKESATPNIVGIILLILVVSLPAVAFWGSDRIDPLEYIKLISPLVCAIVGYLFGKN